MTMTRADIIKEGFAVERVVGESVMELSAPQKGALWLDEHHPGWADRIDLSAFNIESTTHCVIGQLYGDGDEYETGYWKGIQELRLRTEDTTKYGFYARDSREPTERELELAAQATYPDEGPGVTISVLNPDHRAVWAALQAEWQQIIRERQESA